jgi:hypothetical protein
MYEDLESLPMTALAVTGFGLSVGVSALMGIATGLVLLGVLLVRFSRP